MTHGHARKHLNLPGAEPSLPSTILDSEATFRWFEFRTFNELTLLSRRLV